MAGRGALRARARRRRRWPPARCRRAACWRGLDAAAVVGFGGYPSVPPVLAARLLRPPAGGRSCTSRTPCSAAPTGCWRRAPTRSRSASPTPRACRAGTPHCVTGNPVRPAIAALAGQPTTPRHRRRAPRCWCWAARSARACFSRRRPGRRSPPCRPSCAQRLRGRPAMPRRGPGAGARRLCRRRRRRRARRLLPRCRRPARRRASGDRPRRRRRPSPSSPRRPPLHPGAAARTRSTTTRRANARALADGRRRLVMPQPDVHRRRRWPAQLAALLDRPRRPCPRRRRRRAARPARRRARASPTSSRPSMRANGASAGDSG